MSRLWDKGLPLDERVLRYTAGEDHVLDARLVQYDVQGSTAHAEMLAAVGLISDEDCASISKGLAKLGTDFAAGVWGMDGDGGFEVEFAGGGGGGSEDVGEHGGVEGRGLGLGEGGGHARLDLSGSRGADEDDDGAGRGQAAGIAKGSARTSAGAPAVTTSRPARSTTRAT